MHQPCPLNESVCVERCMYYAGTCLKLEDPDTIVQSVALYHKIPEKRISSVTRDAVDKIRRILILSDYVDYIRESSTHHVLDEKTEKAISTLIAGSMLAAPELYATPGIVLDVVIKRNFRKYCKVKSITGRFFEEIVDVDYVALRRLVSLSNKLGNLSTMKPKR